MVSTIYCMQYCFISLHCIIPKFLQPNNDIRKMQGMSVKTLKHHVALWVSIQQSYLHCHSTVEEQ